MNEEKPEWCIWIGNIVERVAKKHGLDVEEIWKVLSEKEERNE